MDRYRKNEILVLILTLPYLFLTSSNITPVLPLFWPTITHPLNVQAANRRANLMHNMAKKERGEAISSQLALLHKKEKDLRNDDDDM